ncbi:serine hydrolase domain-containing protein [Kordiimonas marina]|uniref:serine hydrolase domain-containing protein n=1 Tax=Kordiimonas marina TaxID=2872312 RepID=UPI001FF49473|nr:serine hydrolase domain-containing protein [Kordiimonas marina]MCJ9427602.1 beta-lactamase family protein [Kordiimonas marina]
MRVLVRFRGLILGAFVAAAGWTIVSPAAQAESEEALFQHFDHQFHTLTRQKHIPGGAYAIVRDGEVVRMGTFGVRSKHHHARVDRKTIFRLASVSKTFAADLAGILVEEHKFSLDDPITRYVPDLRFKKTGFAKEIKIRHILSHSAGLMPNSYDMMVEDGWKIDKILPYFKKLKPVCDPGDCYGYQNVLFSLIGKVVERAAGQPYSELVDAHFFKPLGMADASIGYNAFMATKDRADPHVLTRRGLVHIHPSRTYYNVAPAAGVNASIEDMSKWLIAQMGYRPTVLPEPVLKLVTTKQVETRHELYKRQWRRHITDAYYGLGWRLYEFPEGEVVMHAGAVKGYRSLISYSREKNLGLVMLMNADNTVIDRLGANFWSDALSKLTTDLASSR